MWLHFCSGIRVVGLKSILSFENKNDDDKFELVVFVDRGSMPIVDPKWAESVMLRMVEKEVKKRNIAARARDARTDIVFFFQCGMRKLGIF